MANLLGPVTAGAGLLLSVPGFINSYQDEKEARKALAELRSSPMARFAATPELRRGYSNAEYGASNPVGYTGSQRSAFRQKLASVLNSRYAQATSFNGGQSSRAINAVLRGNANDSLNDFAANDANLMNQNRRFDLGRSDSYARQFQAIKDRQTAFDQNYRLQTEQALGGAIQRNKDYRRQTLSSLGSNLMGAGGYLMGRDSDGINPSRYRRIAPEMDYNMRIG